MSDHDHEAPPPLSPSELDLLGAYRAGRSMPSKTKARVAARLSTAVSEPRNASGPSGGWVVALATAAAVLAILGARAWLSKAEPVDEAAPGQQAPFEATPDPRVLPATPRRSADSAAEPTTEPSTEPSTEPGTEPSSPPPGTSAVATPEEAPAAPPARPALTPPTRRPMNEPPPQPSSDDRAPAMPIPASLQDERALLARAWSSLASGEVADALADVAEHTRRFPAGILTVERKAIAAIGNCKRRSVGWKTQARAFLSRHGKTPLARRVRDACGFENSISEKVPPP